MRKLFVLLMSAFCATSILIEDVQAQQPVAVTIEIESIEALLSSMDLLGKGTALPLNRQMLEMTLQQSPMFGDLANLDIKKAVRAYVFLPDFAAAQQGGGAPTVVFVMPVKPGGAGYMSALKGGYEGVSQNGSVVHLTKPTVPGSAPYLFAEVVGASAFLASDEASLKVIRNHHAMGKALTDMPKLVGAIKFSVDVDTVWPLLKEQIKAATANMPEVVPGAPGIPKGMNPKEVLAAEIELFDAFVKDVKTYAMGLKPRANTLDFYSRFDVKPNTKLAKAMTAAGAKPNRYAKVLPSNGHFTMVSSGLEMWKDFIEPYTAFMETVLGSGENAADTKSMMNMMQSALTAYAGDMGLAVVSNPNGEGVGFIEYFHLKDPAEFEKMFADMMANAGDMYKDMGLEFSIEATETRQHKGATITKIAYGMTPPKGAAADPASAMVLGMMSKMNWEYAVVGEDMLYTMGGPQYMNLAIDRLKAPSGTGFMAAKPFATLIPKVKGTPTGAFSLSLVPMLKSIFAAMPNVQAEMLNAIPNESGGIAGFSFQQGNSAAGVARISYSEIKALVSSGQVIGGMVTQMMMGGMMQGAGAAPQAVPANTECRRNLRMIDGAKEQYGTFDVKLNEGDAVDAKGLSTYFPGGSIPACPDGGKYTIGTFGHAPECSEPGHALR